MTSLCLSLSLLLSLCRWYYGNINRQKAEKLLLASQNKDGSFLVRISESHSDEYTISGQSEPRPPIIKAMPTHLAPPTLILGEGGVAGGVGSVTGGGE